MNIPYFTDSNILRVQGVDSVAGIQGQIRSFILEKKRRRSRKGKRKTSELFPTLAKACEEANKKLSRMLSPLKFCIYKRKKDVFLDVVLIDDNGRVTETITRNISDDDFKQWIDDVSQVAGLLYDETV